MNWFSMAHAETDHAPAQAVVPRRILRQLIFGTASILPSRILDLGPHHSEMAGFLELLGFEAAGCDLAGLREFTGPRPDGRPAEPFDLILLREADHGVRDLLGNAALTRTAELLSCLSPGGTLAVLSQRQDRSPQRNPHSADCLRLHLDSWPGDTSLTVFSEGYSGPQPWKRLIGSLPHVDHYCATLTVPRSAISRGEWREIAESLARRAPATCCEFAARGRQPNPGRSVA